MGKIPGAKYRVGMNDSDYGPAISAGTPADGTAGFGAGTLNPGALCIATTIPKLFINTNTKASPTWTVVGGQS
jgi:hypothetical protein